MPPRLAWQQLTITDIRVRTPRIKSFVFARPDGFDFRAGQHVDLRLTAPDGYQAQRSYSIASAPEDAALELAIELMPDGEVSTFFHEVAAVGDDIELRGPIGGHFVWGAADPAPVLLVGGGSGVVPLMSMVRHRTRRGLAARMGLVQSDRTLADVLYRDELAAIAVADSGVTWLPTLTRERDQPGFASGRITADLLRQAFDRLGALPAVTYVCGANPFVEAATTLLLDLALDPRTIRTERFGG
jgi:ferredoxin-NADP reductase